MQSQNILDRSTRFVSGIVALFVLLLVACGGGGNGTSPSPVLGSFAATGSLATARSGHTATLLPNGKVLVVGGYGAGTYIASAELYDPATGNWSATGHLAVARGGHTATLLPNGQVLVAGGYGGMGTELGSAELYDPATGAWTSTGSLSMPHSRHTATLLTNGKVLVASGYCELYDPVTGTWSATGHLATVRPNHTATLLPNGKVLVVGGSFGEPLASSELYDPFTGLWGDQGNLATGRSNHTATLLPNGKVLVVGGWGTGTGPNGVSLSSSELYDPATGTWTGTGRLTTARDSHTATLLTNGRVMVAGGLAAESGGGQPTASAEVYDPATGAWTATGNLITARMIHIATLLLNGKVLVEGGWGAAGILASAELYDPNTSP